MNDKAGLLRDLGRETNLVIVNGLFVSGTGVGHACDSQSFDHVVGFKWAVERSDLNAEHGPIADLRLAHERVADSGVGEALLHGLGISPGRK